MLKYGHNHGEDENKTDHSDWKAEPPIIARKWEYEPQAIKDKKQRPLIWHQHYRAQLLCVQSGMILVKTKEGTWLLPPQRAGWIPPNIEHCVEFCGNIIGNSVFILPDEALVISEKPIVIGMNDLMKSIINRTTDWEKRTPLSTAQKRLFDVLLDEIAHSTIESIYLPTPKDPRLKRIANKLLLNPDNRHSVDYWASIGSLSSRSLRRIIKSETGLSFSAWRQQAQLIHALEKLNQGMSVEKVADSLGYASSSNFIAMFRRAFGDSPAKFIHRNLSH